MADEGLRERIVAAADRLYYGRSVGQVGMDAVRDESGASLKAIYREFPSKEDLVVAVLERRHETWTAGVEAALAPIADPRERVLAVYDFLAEWFAQSGFRGCGFINTFGELGASSPRVAETVRRHKRSFQDYVERLVADAGGGPALGAQLAILAEGAQTTAAIAGVPDAAAAARDAARVLVDAAVGAAAGV